MGAARRSWGKLRTIGSGRIQASYVCPLDGQRYNAPYTFDAKIDAEGWLVAEKRLLDSGSWTPPAERFQRKQAESVTVEEYTRQWIKQRDLAPATRDLYETVARTKIYPTMLGPLEVPRVTPAVVRTWWAGLDKSKPVARRKGYALLRSVLNTAVDDNLLEANPCRLSLKAADERDVEALTVEQLEAVAAEVPEHYRMAVYALAWTSLRFGELIALRRKDVEDDGETMKLRVRQGATRVNGKIVIGETKTVRSKRPVSVPPHVAKMMREHLETRVDKPADAMVFTMPSGTRLTQGALTRWIKRGYQKIGRPELRVHDLRAVGGYLRCAGRGHHQRTDGPVGSHNPTHGDEIPDGIGGARRTARGKDVRTSRGAGLAMWLLRRAVLGICLPAAGVWLPAVAAADPTPNCDARYEACESGVQWCPDTASWVSAFQVCPSLVTGPYAPGGLVPNDGR